MSTSVKISQSSKRLLDTLQAKVVLSAGKKPSQEELLDMILNFSAENEEALIMRAAGIKLPFTRRQVAALLRVPKDLGIVTREEEIDKTLYGRSSR